MTLRSSSPLWVALVALACNGGGAAARPTSSTQDHPAGSTTMTSTDSSTPALPSLGSSIVGWLEQGEHARVRATFDAAMAKALPTDEAVAGLWQSIVAKLGRCQKQLGTSAKDEGAYHVVLVTCAFEAMPMDVRLVFDAEQKLAGIQLRPSENTDAFGPRPQTPKPPFPYAARDVAYPNPADGSTLAGTLTVPEGAGPHPAVLLVTGSGAQDRDETIFGHKPFWVLADHLGRHGVAVLRVDDRGIGKTTGDPTHATIETHATDVEAGLAFLKTQPDVDPKRLGLVGHSEGGIIAAVVAARSKDVAFVVSLAGTGLSGAEINPLQVEAILRAKGGMSEDGIRAIVAAQRAIMKLLATDASDAALDAAVNAAFAAAEQYAPGALGAKGTPAGRAAEVASLRSDWFRSFVKLDPASHWSRVTVPVLALVGDRDTQVPADPNLGAIAAALAKAGNHDAETEKLPGLNHLFQRAQTGLVDEYATLEETFAPAALERVTSFVRQRAGLR
ncbi:MAG: alpha/beta fold hydrolase [Polyangiaceae bacterium]|nr:alpha/beta fold hydrolase [Polyangiaceae bacterium]